MMKNEDALVSVILRNSFYRRQYFLALGAFVLSILTIIILSFVLVYVIRHRSEPLYFATDNVGRLIEIAPVNKPNMSLDEVKAWTVRAVERATSYDYVNYRRQMQEMQNYFTTYGWRTYMAALNANGNLNALKRRRMIYLSKVVDTPKLDIEGDLDGAYSYKFKMQMLLTTLQPPYDDTTSQLYAWNVSVIVQRQPILQSKDGLGILQLVIVAATGDQATQ